MNVRSVLRGSAAGRVIKRIIVAGHPASVYSVRRRRPAETIARLDNNAAAVDVGCQVVAQERPIIKGAVAHRNNNVVLLKLLQGWSPSVGIKEVHCDYVRIRQDRVVKCGGLAIVKVSVRYEDAIPTCYVRRR